MDEKRQGNNLFSEREREYKSCFLVAVGKNASATGYPMVGHNEDDGGTRVKMSHGYVPPKVWAAGSIMPGEKGLAKVPQVEKTFGYFWSESRDAHGGYSVTDGFLNENGVHLVSNNNGESAEDMPDLTDGGISHNLRRAVAERATSARHGAQIIMDLVAQYGYVPSGRAYTVSDKKEIWVVQVVRGKHYVAARVPDDHVAVIPNHYTIHSLTEYEELFYSDGLIEYAIKRGWYTPAAEGDYSDFQFAEAYQAKDSYKIPYNTYRQGYGLRLLGHDYGVDEKGYYPFSVKMAKGSVTLDKVREILCCHFEGTEHDKERIAPGNNPHDCSNMPHDKGYRRICTGYTTESVICQMTEAVSCTTLWMGYGHPCSMPHVPLHPLTGCIPKSVLFMEDPEERAAHKFESMPELMTYEEETGVQRLRDFQCMLDMVYDQHAGAVHRILDTYMKEKYAQNIRLIADGDQNQLIAFDEKAMGDAVEILGRYARENMILVPMESTGVHRISPQTVVVQFTMDKALAPLESSMKFGMGLLDTALQYSRPVKGSLLDLGAGKWQVSFSGEVIASYGFCDGMFEHFIGGRTKDNQAFTGTIKLKFYS